ncbi:MAG TPA: tRNA pseudouridine(38-40) synthase TruA [Bryobacteraceae bacterium]|nr:tRNA pseudouridine(38-40) synthase TruA [Bryobacteraceae bacterium]
MTPPELNRSSTAEAPAVAGNENSRRIRVTLAYDGTDFHGWQIQPGLSTIQGVLEEIVGGLEGRRVHVEASGRTDAGVHALAQVAAFSLTNPIPVDNLQRAVNRLLPPAIRVVAAREAHADFHPRFDSIAKTYRYRMFRDAICSPFDWRYMHHYPYPLNESRMIEAARFLEGEHDFTRHAASDEESKEKSKVRTIFNSSLWREGNVLTYTVRGSGFLKHMVRNLVGTLIEVGRGNLDPADILYRCGSTAPAKGLMLVSVEYPPLHDNLGE